MGNTLNYYRVMKETLLTKEKRELDEMILKDINEHRETMIECL